MREDYGIDVLRCNTRRLEPRQIGRVQHMQAWRGRTGLAISARGVDQNDVVWRAQEPGMHAHDERVGLFVIMVRQQPVTNVVDQLRPKVGK